MSCLALAGKIWPFFTCTTHILSSAIHSTNAFSWQIEQHFKRTGRLFNCRRLIAKKYCYNKDKDPPSGNFSWLTLLPHCTNAVSSSPGRPGYVSIYTTMSQVNAHQFCFLYKKNLGGCESECVIVCSSLSALWWTDYLSILPRFCRY